MSTEHDRNQKIIVALFLLLGKALNQLPLTRRNLTVTESEILEAWLKKESPVRLVMDTKLSLCPTEGDHWGSPTERVYKCILGNLDMTKTGMNFNKPMPAGSTVTVDVKEKKNRVFNLE
jgi:hypothetical protein